MMEIVEIDDTSDITIGDTSSLDTKHQEIYQFCCKLSRCILLTIVFTQIGHHCNKV